MAGSSLLVLIDDIAAVLDDVSLMTKVAAKKTAGVLGDDRRNLRFQRFATGLHEPLGLTRDGNDLLVAQRSEVTRLQDRDRDGVADAYLTEAGGWNVSARSSMAVTARRAASARITTVRSPGRA